MFEGAREPKPWFHGDSSPRSDFSNQRWDRDPSVASRLEFGPGIYFTSRLEEAESYGPYVFQTTVPSHFKLVPRKKPSLRAVEHFASFADDDDRDTFLSNWPDYTWRQALSRYAGADTLYDAFLNLYIDLFRDPDSWVAALRSAGYDGVVLSMMHRQPQRRFLIVWSPEKLRIEPMF